MALTTQLHIECAKRFAANRTKRLNVGWRAMKGIVEIFNFSATATSGGDDLAPKTFVAIDKQILVQEARFTFDTNKIQLKPYLFGNKLPMGDVGGFLQSNIAPKCGKATSVLRTFQSPVRHFKPLRFPGGCNLSILIFGAFNFRLFALVISFFVFALCGIGSEFSGKQSVSICESCRRGEISKSNPGTTTINKDSNLIGEDLPDHVPDAHTIASLVFFVFGLIFGSIIGNTICKLNYSQKEYIAKMKECKITPEK